MKKSDKIRILICGNYGASNLGDEIILKGLINLMKSAFKNSEITVLSSNVNDTEKRHEIKAVKIFPAGFRSNLKFWLTGEFWKSISALKKADLVVLGGGGLFSDERPRAIWIWYVQYLWFRFLGKKMVCLAQSVGPLKSVWAKKKTAAVFKYAKLVTVRDEPSKILLEEIGVKNVQVLADPAYGMAYDSEAFVKKQNYLILTLRKWHEHADRKAEQILSEYIQWAKDELDLETIFIPFQTVGESDLVAMPIGTKLKQSNNIKEIQEIFSRARLVIGMRLHSVILAVLTKTPFIALSYSKKVKDFSATVGMKDFVLDYEKLNLNELKKKTKDLLLMEKEIVQNLEKEKLKNTYKFFDHEKLLQELF